MDRSAAEFDLDIIGVLEGTDKSSSVSFAWDYLRHYQRLFAPWRDLPINFFEIGVETGRSLRLWRQDFSRAQIVGIDINPACRNSATDRVAIETGSQEDPGFLHRDCAKYPPSIIVDDGSHLAHHIVYSFRHLFPMLQAGGVYVVEDLQFHFAPGDPWAGNKTVSVPDYFLGLARQRMAHNIHLDQAWGDDLYIRDHIDAVLFFGGAVAVYKRKARDVAPALMFADRHLKSVDKTPEQLLRLVDYILRHDGRLDHAERVVREAANLAGPGIETHRLLVDILCRQARLGDAAQAAAEATRLWPEEHGTWFRLSLVEVRLGRTGQAIAALERAVSIQPDEAHYHDLLSHLWETQGEPRRALLAAKAAASVHPNYEPRQQRIAMLEQLAATAAGPR